MPPVFPTGVPRVRPEWATVVAAQQARTDRAATLVPDAFMRQVVRAYRLAAQRAA